MEWANVFAKVAMSNGMEDVSQQTTVPHIVHQMQLEIANAMLATKNMMADSVRCAHQARSQWEAVASPLAESMRSSTPGLADANAFQVMDSMTESAMCVHAIFSSLMGSVLLALFSRNTMLRTIDVYAETE